MAVGSNAMDRVAHSSSVAVGESIVSMNYCRAYLSGIVAVSPAASFMCFHDIRISLHTTTILLESAIPNTHSII